MASARIEPHEITLRNGPETPFVVGKPTTPNRGEWENKGKECYIENFSAEDYDHFTRVQFGLPIPPDTSASRRELSWLFTKLKIAFSINGLITGRRSTHMPGVGASGKITILENPDLPETDFFKPGTTFPCRLRHSNAAFIDDCGIVPRGASLKFINEASGGPMDLIFNSGLYGEIFFDAKNFWDFSMSRLKVTPTEWGSQKEFMRQNPACYIGQIEATREPPGSFANLTYSTKIALAFKAKDRKRRFAKIRFLRPDLEFEDGLPSLEVQRRPWHMLRHKDDDRPRDYLRKEFVDTVGNKGVEYRLQIQLWDWDDDRDSYEVFCLARYWDETEHPWLDLARIELDTPLAEEDTEATFTHIANIPDCLAVPDGHHIHDPRSLAWMRVGMYSTHYRARRGRWFLGLKPHSYPKKDELITHGPGGAADPAKLEG